MKWYVSALSLHATNEDLHAEMRRLARLRKSGVPHLGCTVSGFGEDRRELWQIPEVVGFARRLWDQAFVTCLDLTLWLPIGKKRPDPLIAAFGAFEVWAVAEKLIGSGGNLNVPRVLFEKFVDSLEPLNKRADLIVGGI